MLLGTVVLQEKLSVRKGLPIGAPPMHSLSYASLLVGARYSGGRSVSSSGSHWFRSSTWSLRNGEILRRAAPFQRPCAWMIWAKAFRRATLAFRDMVAAADQRPWRRAFVLPGWPPRLRARPAACWGAVLCLPNRLGGEITSFMTLTHRVCEIAVGTASMVPPQDWAPLPRYGLACCVQEGCCRHEKSGLQLIGPRS